MGATRQETGEFTILGIDPGLNTTGYGAIAAGSGPPRLLEAGIIEGGKASLPLAVRLRTIFDAAMSTLDELSPEAMAMEQLYTHYAHPQTAVLMGHVRGVLCLAAGLKEIPVADYPATEVKSSLTGNGHAPKDQVRRAVAQILKLTALEGPADVSDALAVAICHASRVARQGSPRARKAAVPE